MKKETRGRKKIKCVCGDKHRIGEMRAVRTWWWSDGDGHCVGPERHPADVYAQCPTTGVYNRLLFLSYYNVPWERRADIRYSIEKQFVRDYLGEFLDVEDTTRRLRNWQNNTYVDRHAGKFGLSIEGNGGTLSPSTRCGAGK